jgi:hypothetical protein
MAVMTIPQHRPIHGCAAISVKPSRNEARKMLEPPSSGDGKHAINLISAQGPLSTSLRQGMRATYLTR